ncbi:lamin tail domain-containing protein [Verrucomicrobiaceae bacterium 227]
MKIHPGLFLALAASGSLQAEIVINEIHYNSDPNTAKDEFIELYNTGTTEVDLSGWFFQEGVRFTFPAATVIGAGEYLVISQNPAALSARYGASSIGPFDGGLSGSGETVELRQANGLVVDSVTYKDTFPWPVGAGGTGASMELINPSLDNDLGASWRSSQLVVLPEVTLIPESAAAWRWRSGASEASNPLTAWTGEDFVEDGTWSTQAMPIGYGGVGSQRFSPSISGMQGQYSSVFFRRAFTVTEGEIPSQLNLRYVADDGFVVYLNGTEVFRTDNMPEGVLTVSDTATSSGDENNWLESEILGTAGLLQGGENVIAIHAFNSTLGSNDFGLNIELVQPATDPTLPPFPTPGAANSVFATNAPPAIRQVEHSPQSPAANETTVVTAKVTDPDGVASVILEAQVVAPGAYVPAFLAKSTGQLLSNPTGPRSPNPAYEQNWTSYEMRDNGVFPDTLAGDGIFTASLPGEPNRTLVRYRITVTDSLDTEVRVPYSDDDRLNFGYFQYDGVPDYEASGKTYPSEVINSVPVYHILTTAANFDQAVAYNGSDQIPSNNFDARSEYNWSCTFVYDGEVYDNAKYRLRQRNARYSGGGKRSLKFRFNRGNYPVFRDRNGKLYPEPWKYLATHKMLGSRANPTWGMDQATNHLMWNLTGTPASFTHWAHMRIVRGAEEAPNQYQGDYYGMLLALEEFDSRFLDAHNLEKGNLYKLISYRTNGLDVQRYQAADAVADASDFSTIINQLRPARTDSWLNEHVNWDHWNHYHAVVDMIRHYDVQTNTGEHLKNRAFYFEPSATNPLGRLRTLPWDSDTSWGPNWGAGVDFPKEAIFGTSGVGTRLPFTVDYLNTVREMRDLIWTPEQIDLMIAPLANKIAGLVPADRARWQGAIGGSQSDPPLENVVADMKKFAFTGGSWVGGSDGGMPLISRDTGISGQQGRDAYLDALVADAALPATPVITYSGTAGFPQDGLSFTSSPFSDPQGAGSFNAMEWRLAEVTIPGGALRTVMPVGRSWSYLDNDVDQGTAWKDVDFDDSAWAGGPAPMGFGRVDGLTFGTTTAPGIPTAYFRTTVNVTDVDKIDHFIFRLLVDDGAVVWVNGQQAFREGFDPGTVVTHATTADGNGDEDVFDEFEVSSSLFVEGANVIAVEVHNRAVASNDMGFEMSIDAREQLVPAGEDPAFEWTAIWESGELDVFEANIDVSAVTKVGRTYRARVRHEDNTGRWSSWSAPVEFVAGTPTIQPFLDSLVISKIMYHPLPPSPEELLAIPELTDDDFEWIEIMNIGAVPLDLTNLRFTKGVEFDFVAGSKLTIAAGERLLVVGNIAAFNLRHNYATTPDFVLGEFSKNLANSGELVKLSFGAGTLIREIEYDDKKPWPESPDGMGNSLVLIGGGGEAASDWRSSVGSDGAPAVDDSFRLTGGVEALLDYALLSELQIVPLEIGGESFVDVTFDRRINADDARLIFQGSGDLKSWTDQAEFFFHEAIGAGTTGTMRYRIPRAGGMDYFRVKVELR